MTVKLTWTPSAGATTQTVQYKINGAPTWTTHSTVGPTVAVAYLNILDGSYNFRIVNNCTECICQDGSTPVNGNCPGTVFVEATSTGTVVEATPTPYEDFGESGTVVHTNLNPTGPFTQLNTSNYFWREPPLPSNWFSLPHYQRTQALLNNNGPVNRLVVWGKQVNPAGRPLNNYNYYSTTGASSSGYILTIPTTEFVHVNQLVFKGNNPSDGTGTFDGTTLVTDIISPTQVIINKIPILPLSNAVVSFSTISTPPLNTWLGFDVCINVPATRTYHIAIAADNQYRFFLDGVLKLADTRDSTEVFGYLHIYPLEIPAGGHLLRLEGLNTGLTAGFGCEVFDLSDIGSLSVVDYLNQQTDYTNLQSKIIFTTRGVTSFTSNLYSCPSGFRLVNPSCTQVQCTGPGGTVPCTTVAVTPPVISVQKCTSPTVTDVTLTKTTDPID